MQRGIATVFSPVEEAAGRVLKPVRDLVNWFDETFDARGENDALRAEVQELRDELTEAGVAIGENRELRKQVGLGPTGGVEGREAVTAKVIGRSPTVWYSTVTIDQGSGAGVAVDDPVRTGDGLVGRVSDVAPGSSVVTLITDQRSAVSARVLPEGPSGVVKPEVGDPDHLLLDFIENDREVESGAELVTAGWTSGELSSRFPFGIPIGEVDQATIGEQENFQRVTLRPFADLRELDLVQVLTVAEGGGK
jgi:rod shape-determining protein MreC